MHELTGLQFKFFKSTRSCRSCHLKLHPARPHHTPPAIGNFLLGFAQFPLAIYQQRCQSCWPCWKQLAANFAQNLPFFIRSFAQSLLPLLLAKAMDWEFQKTILLAPCQAESHPAGHPQLAAVAATMPPHGAQLKLRSPGPGDAAQFAFHQQNAK